MEYVTRDREAGNEIDRFETITEAMAAIQAYEEDDRRNDCYEEDFYDIAKDGETVTPAPYIVIDDCGADLYATNCGSEAEAIAEASAQWDLLTESDKKRRNEFLILKSVNPDPEAENHFDGDIVRRWK